jgi:hypothetical protein
VPVTRKQKLLEGARANFQVGASRRRLSVSNALPGLSLRTAKDSRYVGSFYTYPSDARTRAASSSRLSFASKKNTQPVRVGRFLKMVRA